MANVCRRQLEYKMRRGTKGISKRRGMNKITINFTGSAPAMWDSQQPAFIHSAIMRQFIIDMP
jgi:hypothetical protein